MFKEKNKKYKNIIGGHPPLNVPFRIQELLTIENHKHCNCCLSVLKEIGRISWRLEIGVTIIYQCNCGIWVDEETRGIKKIYY